MTLTSFKLRFFDVHVRITLAQNDGPVPGVDLRGDEARAAFDAARPMLDWLEAREPGVRVRSLSADLDSGRVLVTIDDGGVRPRVVRIDAPDSGDLLDAGREVVTLLSIRAAEKVRARSRG